MKYPKKYEPVQKSVRDIQKVSTRREEEKVSANQSKVRLPEKSALSEKSAKSHRSEISAHPSQQKESSFLIEKKKSLYRHGNARDNYYKSLQYPKSEPGGFALNVKTIHDYYQKSNQYGKGFLWEFYLASCGWDIIGRKEK